METHTLTKQEIITVAMRNIQPSANWILIGDY